MNLAITTTSRVGWRGSANRCPRLSIISDFFLVIGLPELLTKVILEYDLGLHLVTLVCLLTK